MNVHNNVQRVGLERFDCNVDWQSVSNTSVTLDSQTTGQSHKQHLSTFVDFILHHSLSLIDVKCE